MAPFRRSYVRAAIFQGRGFPRVLQRRFASKEKQERESIDVSRSEYSKSGTDSSAAAQVEAAYDPTVTDPLTEKKVAGKGNQDNALDVSPANPEVSKSSQDISQQTASAEKSDGKRKP
ncbi:hypothetical protein K3495_g2066 [Podosphaera aphanis]|nr:hypothetical protein K3495_g2066 [Podosphaera aphanis]